MTRLPRLLTAAALALPLAACLSIDVPDGEITRSVTRTFEVALRSSVRVDIRGGSIKSEEGAAGQVRVEIIERVRANSDAEIDRLLADYDVTAAQAGDQITVSAKHRGETSWRIWKTERVQFSARLVVPSDVRLDLNTSGGSIEVRGDRQEPLRADTSGGSIRVDGGAGALDLDTSGGSITVDRALGSIKADTSGGSVTVRYVGAGASDVNLSTSGGGIRVGVDPAAALDVSAGTSGGGVRVEGLPLRGDEHNRQHVSGQLNGGGGRLRASTSGGSIVLSAATHE
jgi:hypothetical protein